jgi:hypothetical protein
VEYIEIDELSTAENEYYEGTEGWSILLSNKIEVGCSGM